MVPGIARPVGRPRGRREPGEAPEPKRRGGTKRPRPRTRAFLAWSLGLWLLAATSPALGAPPFPALFPEAAFFRTALARHVAPAIAWRVTGLTVPHHLLAVDLLAEAFSRLKDQPYRRVIILCPDHFRRSRTPFAVAERDFATALGPVAADRAAVARLLACPLVTASNLFSHEHAIQALTPFLAHFFPAAKLVAVAIRASAGPAQWEALATALTPLLDADTLLVQSTDFSHALSPKLAARRDQETLRLLADPDPAKLLGLRQPDHVDCRGALFLQRTLQQTIFHAAPVTVANRNSQAYAPEPLARSTSYMVQYYGAPPAPLAGPNRFFFAGDTFFGRFMANRLAKPAKRRELVRLVRRLTGGAPLIVNLEGVLSPQCPAHPRAATLCQPQGDSLRLLRELGVTVAVLANNHSRDLGPAALRRMARALRQAGITPLPAGRSQDFGPFRLAALTDLDNAAPDRRYRRITADIARLAGRRHGKPLFVMIHWGREFALGPDAREHALADAIGRAGAQCVIGAHPHRAWPLACDARTCRAWSLGNFLFDQSGPDADGALLEVRFFPQGTYALRRIPVGNLYRKLGAGRGAAPDPPREALSPWSSPPGDASPGTPGSLPTCTGRR